MQEKKNNKYAAIKLRRLVNLSIVSADIKVR